MSQVVTPAAIAAPEPALMTVPEVCARLRVSRWMFYRLVQSGQLRTIKLGARRLVPVEAVVALVAQLREDS